jgi:hypothetical protein
LTQALDITKRHHEIDLCSDPAHCFRRRPNDAVRVLADPRVGISRAKDFPWRFTLRESPFVSVPVRFPKFVIPSRHSAARDLAVAMSGFDRIEDVNSRREVLRRLRGSG